MDETLRCFWWPMTFSNLTFFSFLVRQLVLALVMESQEFCERYSHEQFASTKKPS